MASKFHGGDVGRVVSVYSNVSWSIAANIKSILYIFMTPLVGVRPILIVVSIILKKPSVKLPIKSAHRETDIRDYKGTSD